MKALGFIVAVALLIWLGFYLAAPKDGTDETTVTHETHASKPPTTTNTDATDVFQKAFWKRPTPADKILHAERREWADADGVKKWQWFIAVEPSPELVKHLREDNAFGLVRAASIPKVSEAPDWFSFKAGDIETLQSPHGALRLFFNTTKPLLYATDTGGGFRPGAPEPTKPAPASAAVTGRLPLTAPPNPPPDPQ